MDQNHEIDDLEVLTDDSGTDESVSVDDFIRELEEKEKDLHITADTTIIEIAQGFDDGNPSEFIKEIVSGGHAPEPADTPRQPEPEPLSDTAGEIETLETELTVLRERVAELEAERLEARSTSQRRAKDFEAFRTRTEREIKSGEHGRIGDLVGRLLPAIDNLNRALDFAAIHKDERSDDFRDFFDGMMLVDRQVSEIFAGMGVEPILAIGEEFDPHLHEAVATEETDEYPINTICGEMIRGYRIGDHVIRHSMVKVAVPSNTSGPDEPMPENAGGDDPLDDSVETEIPLENSKRDD
jgi:molecular chaperone GrpE